MATVSGKSRQGAWLIVSSAASSWSPSGWRLLLSARKPPPGPSTRPSPATASRRPTSARRSPTRPAWRSRPTARSSWSAHHRGRPRHRLRPGPLQPGRLARHELRRRRQADDRLRRLRRERRGVAIQADGKIVVVGATSGRRTTTSRSPATTRTARSTRASPATASRPPTSGPPTRRTGWRSRPTARSSSSAAPAAAGAGGDFALARYNPNGSLDTSFAGDGKQTTDFGWLRRGLRGGAPGRRQDRRCRRRLDAPTTTSPSPATTRTARSTPASPATASRRPTSVASTPRGGVAIQADGKIVVAGGAERRGADFALARYNPNGSLDTSFQGDGKLTTDFGGLRRRERGGIQANGKIVASCAATATTSRSPDTTPTARSTRASRRRQADDASSGARPAPWRSRRMARSSRSVSPVRTPPLPATTSTARWNELLRGGRQTTAFGGSEGRAAWRSRRTARSSRSARPEPTEDSTCPMTT